MRRGPRPALRRCGGGVRLRGWRACAEVAARRTPGLPAAVLRGGVLPPARTIAPASRRRFAFFHKLHSFQNYLWCSISCRPRWAAKVEGNGGGRPAQRSRAGRPGRCQPAGAAASGGVAGRRGGRGRGRPAGEGSRGRGGRGRGKPACEVGTSEAGTLEARPPTAWRRTGGRPARRSLAGRRAGGAERGRGGRGRGGRGRVGLPRTSRLTGKVSLVAEAAVPGGRDGQG